MGKGKLLIISAGILALTSCLDIYRQPNYKPYGANDRPMGHIQNPYQNYQYPNQKQYQNQYPDIDQQHYYNQFQLQGRYNNSDQRPTVQQYQQYPTYDNDSTYQQGYRSYQTPRPAQRYPSYRAPTPAQTAPRTYSPPRSRGLSGGASDYDVSR